VPDAADPGGMAAHPQTRHEQPHGLCGVDDAGSALGGLVHYLFHRSTWTETSYCYLEDLFRGP
jgi:hypothetical protein